MNEWTEDGSAGLERRHEPLQERIYRAVKEDILSARLGPHDVIAEPQLARRFGVSRSPVREALGRLRDEGLVLAVPRKGYLVRPVSLADVVEVLGLRKILEPALAAEAARRRTPQQVATLRDLVPREETGDPGLEGIRYSFELHDVVAQIAGNSRARAVLRSLLDETARIIPWLTPSLRLSSIEEHTAIVSAIEAGDGPAAAEQMRRHLEAAQAYTLAALSGS